MQKPKSLQIWSFKTVLLFSMFMQFSFNINGQCSCGSDPDIDPSGYQNDIVPEYDANGFVNSYYYSFQFPCLGEPLEIVDFYYYGIIYREKGTSHWTVDYLGGQISQGGDLRIAATNLDPCKTYEVRVTCPECNQPFAVVCDSEKQLDEYLNDESNTVNNVSRIWEVCYAPIQGRPIMNFKVSGIDPINNSVNVSWDHLPGDAVYTLEYRKLPSLTWLPLGTTNIYKYIITNLDPCAEYQVRIQGSAENCCGGTKKSQQGFLKFVMTDCMSTITNVDQVTGNSAHVTWDFLGSNSSAQEFEVQWWKSTSNILTATVTTNEYTLTGLDPNANYTVKIISKCGPGVCSGYSQEVKFHTSCELHEPNNTFQTATPISFNSDIGNSNITPVGDVDFFKFTPSTCFIEVLTDHPDLDSYPNSDPFYYSTIDLPYVLYDQNFQEVPKTEGYWDGDFRHDNTHMVTAGQEYYIAIHWWNDLMADIDCYNFKVYPCDECESLANAGISGEANIYSIPSTHGYGLGLLYSEVDWEVSGPAELQPGAYPSNCSLNFYDVGIVTLTANIRRCDGTSVSIHKEITVSDECNIVGSYSNAHQGGTLYEGFNFISSQNFVITLDLPPGVSFSVYPNGDGSSWVIDGNKIIMTQTASVSSIRIVLIGENCTGIDGIYTFIKWPSGPMKPPVEWSISPNPTSNLLQINPVVLSGIDPNTVPSSLEIRLFNQNSNLVQSHQGTTLTPASLSLANLQPGSYSLQLLYGEYWQEYTVIKQ